MRSYPVKQAGAYQKYILRKWLVLLVMVLLTIMAGLGSLMSGSAGLNLWEVILALSGRGTVQTGTIVWNVRMPRIAAALVVGAALAMCGCIMQNVLRNPLASASTLGVSQGASFGAAVSIICLGAGSQVNTGSGSASSLTITNPAMVTFCAFGRRGYYGGHSGAVPAAGKLPHYHGACGGGHQFHVQRWYYAGTIFCR